MLAREIVSIDDFLSHLTIPPVQAKDALLSTLLIRWQFDMSPRDRQMSTSWTHGPSFYRDKVISRLLTYYNTIW